MPSISSYLLDPLTGLPKTAGRTAKNNALTPPIDFSGGTTSSLQQPGAGTAASSFPGSTSIPGFTPDYAALIKADPQLGQANADFQAQGITDAASRNSAINRLIVQLGIVPDLQKTGNALGLDLSGLIDPTTADLAKNNQYSLEANINRSHDDALRQIKRALAARGGLQSGELGFQLGKENTAYGQAQNDAVQAATDKIGGAQSAYAEGQRAAQAALRQEQANAALRQAQLNPPTGASTADLIGTDPNGAPVYRHADGRLFNYDGSPYTGPGVTSGGGGGGQQSNQFAGITGASHVPGYGPGVTNDNLASLLFGGI